MDPSPRTSYEPPPNTPPNLSAPELTKDVIERAKTLLRDEFELARTEIMRDAREFMRDGLLLGSAALLGLYLLGFMLLAIMYWIGLALPLGLAAFIVSLIVLVVATPLAIAGWVRIKKVNLEPERTVRTLKENAQWAGQQLG